MLVVCYPKCSTCKRAIAWLKERQIDFRERDIKEENPTYAELLLWYKMSGLSLSRFFNTSGLLYKSMNLKERLPTMTEEEKLRLLASDGMLVKRPLLITGERILVGFREAEWESALL